MSYPCRRKWSTSSQRCSLDRQLPSSHSVVTCKTNCKVLTQPVCKCAGAAPAEEAGRGARFGRRGFAPGARQYVAALASPANRGAGTCFSSQQASLSLSCPFLHCSWVLCFHCDTAFLWRLVSIFQTPCSAEFDGTGGSFAVLSYTLHRATGRCWPVRTLLLLFRPGTGAAELGTLAGRWRSADDMPEAVLNNLNITLLTSVQPGRASRSRSPAWTRRWCGRTSWAASWARWARWWRRRTPSTACCVWPRSRRATLFV